MNGTVLIVDDQEDIRCMMAIYLKLNRYEVIEAVNGYEAIEKALAYKPDVILMDMAMPVLNGLDSTRAMKDHEELATIPILCLTAYGEFYDVRAKAAGCEAVLHKPIDFNRLDAFLERYIH